MSDQESLIYEDFREAGYRFFGLLGVDKLPEGTVDEDGKPRLWQCHCGDESCDALHKHPWFSGWQHSPVWSDEQIENMIEAGQLDNGYGVVLDGLLVVDVDARNGGVASYTKLLEDIPEIAGAGLIVESGSGNGSRHLYFTVPDGISLSQEVAAYPGIDFKSSGFIVGPGSKHISGNRYKVLIGSPYDIAPAPQALIDLLRRPEYIRADVEGISIDITESDIRNMLSCFRNDDVDYGVWIKIGMALHHATQGTGFDLWVEWSEQSAKFNAKHKGIDYAERKWHSFGKAANPVTLGTLMHYAKQAGWKPPVTFDAGDAFADVPDPEPEPEAPESGPAPKPKLPFSVDGIDLLRPPGFVGEVAAWINQQGYSKRERLAVAAALTAIGNVAGLRYVEDLTGATLNLFTFCVAGSGTGKEAILRGFQEVHRASGMVAAVHGNFKSDKELVENLIRHQAAFYAVDEVGTVLTKVYNAINRGGAAYLEGLIGQLMSVYSKANGTYLLTGDKKEEVKTALMHRLSDLQRRIDKNEDPSGHCAQQVKSIMHVLSTIDTGIHRPFLSLLGLTVPSNFNQLVSPEFVINGFMSRALLFQEFDNNPKPRLGHMPPPMPKTMQAAIMTLANGKGYENGPGRIENQEEPEPIPTEPEAVKLLQEVAMYFWKLGGFFAEANGFESVCRRGYELVTKVSAILAAPGGLRTVEHVKWAAALVDRDLEEKARLAFENDESQSKESRLASRILNRLDTDTGMTVAVLHNRLKGKVTRETIQKELERMEKAGLVEQRSVKKHRTTTIQWFKIM